MIQLNLSLGKQAILSSDGLQAEVAEEDTLCLTNIAVSFAQRTLTAAFQAGVRRANGVFTASSRPLVTILVSNDSTPVFNSFGTNGTTGADVWGLLDAQLASAPFSVTMFEQALCEAGVIAGTAV